MRSSILFVALTYAELGAMFPESGGAVRYGHYSHGSLVGFVCGVVRVDRDRLGDPGRGRGVGAIHEFLAVAWAQGLYTARRQRTGRADCPRRTRDLGVLVVIYFLLNFWGVKIFAHANSAITFFKLIVPAATAIALMCTSFTREFPRRASHGGVHVRPSRLDPDRGGHQRHRLQLQRLPESREPGRRGAQSRAAVSRSRYSARSASARSST